MDEALMKELEELRELHRQAMEQKDLDNEEIAALRLTINTASFNSPVANVNLRRTINTAVPIDEQRLNDALSGINRDFDDVLSGIHRDFDGRLHDLHNMLTCEADAREDRMLQHITALISSSISNNIFPNVAPQSTVLPNINPNPSNVAPTSTVPQNISSNLGNVAPTSTVPQSSNLAASTSPASVSSLAASTSPLPALPSIHHDYDKSVEVEQRKLVNPETTPTSVRLWLILFDTYSKHPNRLLSMTEAFGDKSIMSLRFMFPDRGKIPRKHRLLISTGYERGNGQRLLGLRRRLQSHIGNHPSIHPSINPIRVNGPRPARTADQTNTRHYSARSAHVSTAEIGVNSAFTYNLSAKQLKDGKSISTQNAQKREKQPQPKLYKRYIYSITTKTKTSIPTIREMLLNV